MISKIRSAAKATNTVLQQYGDYCVRTSIPDAKSAIKEVTRSKVFEKGAILYVNYLASKVLITQCLKYGVTTDFVKTQLNTIRYAEQSAGVLLKNIVLSLRGRFKV